MMEWAQTKITKLSSIDCCMLCEELEAVNSILSSQIINTIQMLK